MSRSPRYIIAAISSLVLVAFLARAISLDAQSLWRDEVDALRFATAPWSKVLSNFTHPGWNGPLYYLLLRGWISLTGTSEYAMRFFSLLFGVLCVPLAYALGRRLFDSLTGRTATLFVTLSPYLVWYGQEVKMYTLVSALALLAIYGLCRAVEENGWHWWAVQVVSTTLAFYCHILAALLIPVQILLYFAWWARSRRRWRGALISLACLTLPYLPLADWQLPMALQARDTGFQYHPLPQMVEILLNGWSTGIRGQGWPWGVVVLGALAVWGMIPLISPSRLLPTPSRWRHKRSILALLIWLLTPLLLVWLVSLRQPLFTDRYLIWAAPAFYLLIAYGLTRLHRIDNWGRWAVLPLIGVILALNVVNLWHQATVPIKSNFRAAASYVADRYRANEASGPQDIAPDSSGKKELPFKCYLPLIVVDQRAWGDLIIFQIPYVRYTFDYYFPIQDYPWAEGLYTNHRGPDGAYVMSEEEAAWRMRKMTEDFDAVWLIASEMSMWDDRGLVKQWLDEHMKCVIEEHFAYVDVYKYVK